MGVRHYYFYIFIFNLLCCFRAEAQSVAVGLSLGVGNYSGDLTESVANVVKQSHPAGGIHLRYDFSNMISLLAQYSYLNVSADDKLAKAQWQQDRGLNFKSVIHEFCILGQLNIMGFFTEIPMRNNFYLTSGIGFFRFNPKALYQGNWIELKPLGTEGQGLAGMPDPYKLSAISLAFGFGHRYFLSSNLSIAIEYLTRQTRTDYLDDASTNYVDYETLKAERGEIAAELGNKIRAPHGWKRAEFNNRDWYNSLMFTVAYHFGADVSFKGIRIKKQGINCPKF